MSKKLLKERFDKALLFLENREDLSIGTEAYEKFLEEMIDNLRVVKKSLRPRSNREHRKEADRIQSAINAMKYLSNKSRRILNNSMISEEKDHTSSLSRQDIKNFIKSFK